MWRGTGGRMFPIIRCPWKSRDVTIHGVAVNSNLGRHFESPAVMGRPRFRPLRASSWLFSVVNNQAVNSNIIFLPLQYTTDKALDNPLSPQI